MNLTGAEYLMSALAEEGVEIVFGYPGAAVLEICDAFAKSPVRFVLSRHEQGAIMAADGYARATGKVGVCLATSGPGATNLITGLANAHMDSVPLVAITGQVSTPLLGSDAFQEADMFGITLPVTKHNFLVHSARELPLALRQAFHIAGTGRRGPVLLDIPRDVAQAEVVGGRPQDLGLPGYRPTETGHPLMLRRAAQALLAASRPVIWAGGGVVAGGAAEWVVRLAEATGTPVTMSLMGLGAVPHDHPLGLGMLGMHGTPWANYALRECDLLFALGVRFDDRATGRLASFAPDARVVHIDIDPAEIGKLRKPVVPVVSDLATALPEICGLVNESLTEAGRDAQPARTQAWRDRLQAYRNGCVWPPLHAGSGGLHPGEVIMQLGRVTNGDAIVVADVGQNQMWTAQLFPVRRPREFLTSGGLGSMGYALPAAIGAQMGSPGRTVVAVVGDGGLQMSSNELATIADQGLPVKVLLLNNGYLGMVRQLQEMFFERRYSAVKLGGPDFAKLAEAYGIRGMRVQGREQLPAAVREMLQHPGAVLLECAVDPEANVFPIVPPGKGSEAAIEAPVNA